MLLFWFSKNQNKKLKKYSFFAKKRKKKKEMKQQQCVNYKMNVSCLLVCISVSYMQFIFT